MTPELITILMFGGVLIGAAVGIPLAFVLGSIGALAGIIVWGPGIDTMLVARMFGVMNMEVLVALPLFIFMGCMMESSGTAQRLYSAALLLIGRLRGGLAILTVMVATIFAACTGITSASITTMGVVALPPMLRYKYNKSLATGVIMAGGTLGVLIPPSIMLIMYAPTAGLPVVKLFAAAIMPGLLLSTLFIIYVAVRCFLNPQLGPPASETGSNLPLTKILLEVGGSMIPPLFIILAVLGSILLGIVAVTEAAALGAASSILLTAIYRQLNWRNLKLAAYRTMEITTMVIWIVIGASIFTGVFIALGGGGVVARFLVGVPGGATGMLVATMAVVFVLGKFIDWVGILLIVVPIVTPIAADLGFDPIWFALLICINLQTSHLTPPFAYAIFYMKGASPPEVTLGDIYRGVIPFVLLQMLGLALVIIFPQIALWLPNLLFG